VRDVSHVGDRQIDVQASVGRGLPRVCDRLGRDIGAGDDMAARGQCQAVPATAAGHVDNA